MKTYSLLFLILLLINCKPTEIEPDDDLSLYLEHLKKYPKGIFRENSDIFDYSNMEDLALKVENNVRAIIPHAGNQLQDIKIDNLASAKNSIGRLANDLHFSGDNTSSRIKNVLKTASAAHYFKGGLCNEYSALTFTNLMQHELDEPLLRLWSRNSIHSFTTIGDPRDSKNSQIVVDPWTIKRDPTPYKKTRMAIDYPPYIVNLWKERYKGEGKVIVQEHNKDMDENYLENGIPKCLEDKNFLFKIGENWKYHKHNISRVIRNYKDHPRLIFDIETNRLQKKHQSDYPR